VPEEKMREEKEEKMPEAKEEKLREDWSSFHGASRYADMSR
jgi:hypothetical protein